MVEEALLGGLKSRTGCRFRLAVEGALAAAGDAGGFERGIEVVMDDLLSRGSGNAEERGVTGEFP